MNNQYIIPIFIAGSLVLVLFAFFLVMYFIIQKNKQNRFALEKQQMQFDYENEILRTKLDVNESTMNQISLELHDNVGQILFLAEMNTSKLSGVVQEEHTKTMVADIGKFVRQAIADLRNISHSLNSEQIKQMGLVEAIKRDLKHVEQSKDIVCSINVTGNQVSLAQDKELMMFRIVQEAISNALKHAKATKLDLNLDYTGDKVSLEIADNGKGFDSSNPQKGNGVGLINMKQRAKVLGSTMHIESSEGNGCKLSMWVEV